MPIPPALAARLAKRGLIENSGIENRLAEDKDTSAKLHDKPETDAGEEEVIAEDYDDDSNTPEALSKFKRRSSDALSDDLSVDGSYKKFKGHIGCPNKINIFHDCTKFCDDHWKEGKKYPDPKYLRKKSAMLAKYPLPSHWKEIYDPGVGVHYYWEVDSDAVSWLPPSHPRAVITRPAAVERCKRFRTTSNKENTIIEEDSKSDSEDESDEDAELDKLRDKKKLRLEAQEKARAKGRKKLKGNNIDPMDPASYSDIPRGGWSDGLFKGNEAKTGVDVTASGPLYQMRPYPTPGAILKANAEHKKSKSKQKND